MKHFSNRLNDTTHVTACSFVPDKKSYSTCCMMFSACKIVAYIVIVRSQKVKENYVFPCKIVQLIVDDM